MTNYSLTIRITLWIAVCLALAGGWLHNNALTWAGFACGCVAFIITWLEAIEND